MSLILDALNRSRRESEPVPGILTEHSVPQAPAKNTPLWLALACSVLLILWLVFVQDDADSPKPTQQGAVTALSDNVSSALTSVKTPLQARTDEAAPKAQNASSAAPAQKATRMPAPVASEIKGEVKSTADAGLSEPQLAPGSRVAVENASAAPDSAALERESIAALYRQQALEAVAKPAKKAVPKALAEEPGAVVAEQIVDVEKALLAAREELEHAKLVEHSAPFLSTLSQATKDAIPTVLYQRHDYSSTGGSSVVLNSTKLREGGSPAAGMKVREILPHSVVLEHRGTVFRLRSLNSWVNL